ncbi:MAG: prephenate dehydratase domain-containing protein [Patescibacteria group bacterium]
MKKVCLGPKGTFSERALRLAWGRFGLPRTFAKAKVSYAQTNEEVIPMLSSRLFRAAASLAVHTLAEGCLSKSFDQIASIDLDTGVRVIGAIELPISFALLAREGVRAISGIISHERAVGACGNYLGGCDLPVTLVDSNSLAAELISEVDVFARYATFAPIECAELYGLSVLDDHCEDGIAKTLFYILGKNINVAECGVEWRALIIADVGNMMSDLASLLATLAEYGINIVHLHTVSRRAKKCRLCIEIEGVHANLANAYHAIDHICRFGSSHAFGPFPLIRL